MTISAFDLYKLNIFFVMLLIVKICWRGNLSVRIMRIIDSRKRRQRLWLVFEIQRLAKNWCILSFKGKLAVVADLVTDVMVLLFQVIQQLSNVSFMHMWKRMLWVKLVINCVEIWHPSLSILLVWLGVIPYRVNKWYVFATYREVASPLTGVSWIHSRTLPKLQKLMFSNWFVKKMMQILHEIEFKKSIISFAHLLILLNSLFV